MNLQTAPNGGIPPGRRRLTADDLEQMMKPSTAAGIAFTTPDGRALFVRRGADGDHAGEWCFPGGSTEDGETPVDTARREATEETGYDASGPMKLLGQNDATGVDYTTFHHPVAEQFEATLNDENSESVWAPIGEPPEPLHPGVRPVLENLKSRNQDQEFKVSGAEDHALTMAFDRDSVRSFDRDGRLRIARAHISKATVNPYWGREIPMAEALGLEPDRQYMMLRDPDELAKAAQSFNGVPVLRRHVKVDAIDYRPEDVVGALGTDCVFEDGYLDNSMIIWALPAIEGIESEERQELSSSYHYRADMTPGNFNGMRYDGVMRDIVGNHVALVEDGRAGPDVLVGDSAEGMMSDNKALASKINAIALRATSVQALNTYLKPRLAMDAKINYGEIFKGVTGAKFKDSTKVMAERIRAQASGKIAKDASLDQVEQVLDMLSAHEVDAGDESVSEKQHDAMAAAAQGQSDLGIPEKVGKEFVSKDAEPLRKFLTEKGMAADDIETAMGMMPKPAADADPDDDDEITAKDKDMPDKEKDKDTVTKPAMDAAIAAACDATAKRVRATERGIREALVEVRPLVGELSMAFDSAEGVYRKALEILQVPGAKDIHESALKSIVAMQVPKAAARRDTSLAMDSGAKSRTAERFPQLSRIGTA